MEINLNIIPFQSVGPVQFGMNSQGIKTLLKKDPESEYVGFLGNLNLQWDNISFKFNENDSLEEITFFNGIYKPFIHNINVFEEPLFEQKINSISNKSFNIGGTDVYLQLGISIAGFSNNEADRSITVFNKSTISVWETLYNNKMKMDNGDNDLR